MASLFWTLCLCLTLDVDFVDSIVDQCRDHAVYDFCCNGSVVLAVVRNMASKFKQWFTFFSLLKLRRDQDHHRCQSSRLCNSKACRHGGARGKGCCQWFWTWSYRRREGRTGAIFFTTLRKRGELIGWIQAYNKKLKKLVDDERDDVPQTAEMGENQNGFQKKKKGRVKLEDLTRYTMVKRIW